jgi:hypothetical protein
MEYLGQALAVAKVASPPPPQLRVRNQPGGASNSSHRRISAPIPSHQRTRSIASAHPFHRISAPAPPHPDRRASQRTRPRDVGPASERATSGPPLNAPAAVRACVRAGPGGDRARGDCLCLRPPGIRVVGARADLADADGARQRAQLHAQQARLRSAPAPCRFRGGPALRRPSARREAASFVRSRPRPLCAAERLRSRRRRARAPTPRQSRASRARTGWCSRGTPPARSTPGCTRTGFEPPPSTPPPGPPPCAASPSA